MKLILTAAVDHLGIAGDIVEVKDGYGRNYLLPQGFAIRWTRGAEKQIEGINRAREARTVRDHAHAGELRTQLESLDVQVPARVSTWDLIRVGRSPSTSRAGARAAAWARP